MERHDYGSRARDWLTVLIPLTVAGCAIVVTVGCWRGGNSNTLVVKGLKVIDEKGRERLTIETSKKDGAPVLSLIDGSGAPRIRLSLEDGSMPKCVLLDDRQRNRLELALTEEGVPTIGLYGEDGRLRAWAVASDPGGLLILSDSRGPRLQLGKVFLKPEHARRTQDWSLVMLDADGQLGRSVP